MSIMVVDGEEVVMSPEQIAELEATQAAAAEQSSSASQTLTIRVFRSRFAETDEDIDLYDELDARMEAERSRLVKQQWRDPGAEIVEGAALYNAIAAHLDTLTTQERKAELLARP